MQWSTAHTENLLHVFENSGDDLLERSARHLQRRRSARVTRGRVPQVRLRIALSPRAGHSRGQLHERDGRREVLTRRRRRSIGSRRSRRAAIRTTGESDSDARRRRGRRRRERRAIAVAVADEHRTHEYRAHALSGNRRHGCQPRPGPGARNAQRMSRGGGGRAEGGCARMTGGRSAGGVLAHFDPKRWKALAVSLQ